jgi:membrane peptidoglycan carboxypeptidase
MTGMLLGGVALLALVFGGMLLMVYGWLAGRYDLEGLTTMPERTVVLDRHGVEMGRLHGEERVIVPLSTVSPWFVKALLAREDTRFYQHSGIDLIGVARAAARNLRERRVVQGASTLTMQLARNTFPDLNERTFHRKLIEVMLARRIERHTGKDQILEHYVNRIFFGPGLWGIQRASQAYFGCHASQLTLSQSALIAGIIRSPSRLNPLRNPRAALRERDTVLARMLALGMITPEQELDARYEEMVPRAQPVFVSQGGYGLDVVKRELDEVLERYDLREGGLRVITTLDTGFTEAVEAAVERRLREVEATPGYKHSTKAAYDRAWDRLSNRSETPYLQAALCVVDNDTGGLLALAGGRDYTQSRFNRATGGARQMGSVVKPFVFAAAIARGLLPGTCVSDGPLQDGEVEGAEDWRPANADRKSLGLQPLRAGLILSRNLMTVRAGAFAGLDAVQTLLKDAGIGARMADSPQVFIGNASANALQVAAAYTVFANHGVMRRPFAIQQIQDRQGRVLYQHADSARRVLAPGVAAVLRRLLERSAAEGAGADPRRSHGLPADCAGKTGTTNDFKDAWFAGFTGSLCGAVWIGLDRADTIIPGGFGGKLALPLWADVMKAGLERQGAERENPPAPVPQAQVRLCAAGGGLAGDGCVAAGCHYEDTLPYELIPAQFCNLHGGTPGRDAAEPEGAGLIGRLKLLINGE